MLIFDLVSLLQTTTRSKHFVLDHKGKLEITYQDGSHKYKILSNAD